MFNEKDFVDELYKELHKDTIETIETNKEQKIICWFVNLPKERREQIYFKEGKEK